MSRLYVSSCVRSWASLLAQRNVRHRFRNDDLLARPRADPRVRLRKLTHALLLSTHLRLLCVVCWTDQHHSPPPSQLCAWRRVSRAWVLQLFVAILLWSALAEVLSVDAIVPRVPRRPLGRAPAEAQSLRLCAAVAAAFGCVPRGQRALLDADMNALIDQSSCLVAPVLVARALLLFPVLVRSAPSTSSAASSRCSRTSPSRGLVEGLVLPRCSFREPLCCCCALAASSGTPVLITTRCIPAEALQVVISCDICLSLLSFECDSGVLELLGCVS